MMMQTYQNLKLLHFTIGLIRICQKKKLTREINMQNLLVSSSKCSCSVCTCTSLYCKLIPHMFHKVPTESKVKVCSESLVHLEMLLCSNVEKLCMWLILNCLWKYIGIISIFRAAEARNRLRIMRLRYQANRVSTPVTTLYLCREINTQLEQFLLACFFFFFSNF